MQNETSALDELIQRCRRGDANAKRELVVATYENLYRHARRLMGFQRRNHSLQATGLVGELIVRLQNLDWEGIRDAGHFLKYSSQAMKTILMDYAKTRNREKRGGGTLPVALDEIGPVVVLYERQVDLLDLDGALQDLAAIDPRSAEILEMTYFGRYRADEVAVALGVSTRTVERRLEFARSWLRGRLRGKGSRS